MYLLSKYTFNERRLLITLEKSLAYRSSNNNNNNNINI
jgi:hypothetical protein